jgi:hypothetical protein
VRPINLLVRPICVLLVTVAMLSGTATDAAGQMFMPTGRNTLRGLPGVEVVVESLEPEIERAGLTAVAIRADVVGVLQAGGVRVYASQHENPSPAKPYLYVLVNALTLPRRGGHAVGVQVHLRQSLVSAVTSSNIVNAMTWDAHTVLVARPGGLRLVRVEIQMFVKQFVADWAAVH